MINLTTEDLTSVLSTSISRNEPAAPSPPPEPRLEPQQPVPLTASVRITPIHELLPDIRVPAEPLPPHRYHPVTCAPLDVVELSLELQQLRKEHTTPVAALKAQRELAKEVKRRMEQTEAKMDSIQKQMKRKTEERDTERRVFSKIKKEKEGKM
ncbi:hypothetical protein CISG_01989 [Coccidioides immitis RMSCC 3703]|uniref:Uncharacterized protein n=1 Tax=Coccidioides immitis RMSCC 3703 TaxID=454286 RepID=A0A0J8R4B3_COCIT|nr:hypothetical protein CISG_01989 [Coccidioides immitis RMSCC 3703]